MTPARRRPRSSGRSQASPVQPIAPMERRSTSLPSSPRGPRDPPRPRPMPASSAPSRARSPSQFYPMSFSKTQGKRRCSSTGSPASGPTSPPRIPPGPSLEAFERRELLTSVATPFLQGTVFVDSDQTGVRAPPTVRLADATVNLYPGHHADRRPRRPPPRRATCSTATNVSGGLRSGRDLHAWSSRRRATRTPGPRPSPARPGLGHLRATSIQVTVVDPNTVIGDLHRPGTTAIAL